MREKNNQIEERRLLEEKELHQGAVCSYCGQTVTEDEYSCGQSDCHKKDVVSEEEYILGY